MAGASPSLVFKLPRRGQRGKQAQSKRSQERKTYAMCVCMVCVCAWCVCVRMVCTCACVCTCGVSVHGCVCAHGVSVHGVCVCVHGVCVHVWCVCSWCAHVCGCVCVQRECHPVTLANTAHTWARAVTSHPGHRTWSAVTRLRPHGLCGRVCGESLWRGCETGPSEVTRLVTVGKQKSLDPREKGARAHCTVASAVV